MSMLCLRVLNTKVLHFRSWPPLNGSVRLNISTKQIAFLTLRVSCWFLTLISMLQPQNFVELIDFKYAVSLVSVLMTTC